MGRAACTVLPLPQQLQDLRAGPSSTHPRSRNFLRVFLSRPMVGLAGSGGLASLLSSFGRERGEKLASVLAAFLLLLMTV